VNVQQQTINDLTERLGNIFDATMGSALERATSNGVRSELH
jgi:hypothetical protein